MLDPSFHLHCEMINPANVIKIITNRVSNLLSSVVPNNAVTTNVITRRESEVG